MNYLYLNNKGKYERLENQKELTRVMMFLFGLGLLGLLLGL